MGIVSSAWNNGVQISYKLPRLSRAKTDEEGGKDAAGSGRPNPVVRFVLARLTSKKRNSGANLGASRYATLCVHGTQKIAFFSPLLNPVSYRYNFTRIIFESNPISCAKII